MRRQFFIVVFIFGLLYTEASPQFHRINKRAKECTEIGLVKCNDPEKCINPSWICDGDNDCGDNSDEIGCDEKNCTSEEFKCKSENKCIPAEKICDGKNNCGDSSDEIDCSEERCSKLNKYSCKNKAKCIYLRFVCDGDNDCGDNSDEIGCDEKNCTSEEFKCKSENKCIPTKKICDGKNNCGDSSDEIDCSEERCSKLNKYSCKNKAKCIYLSFVCDRDNDCGDNSDEIDCGREIMDFESCKPEEYKCEYDNRCILKEKLCDGRKNCLLGDDENEVSNCQKSKTCTGFQCHDGQCLEDRRQVCDGIIHCNDTSDESNCTIVDPTKSSTEAVPVDCEQANGMFLCGNNKCIPLSQSCDGQDDCGDNSDENTEMCKGVLKDSSTKSPEQHRDAPWTAPVTCNFSANYKDKTPHITFNFFFKK